MKKNISAILIFAAAIWTAAASAGEKMRLWPAGKMPDAQPHQIAATTAVANKKGFKADEWREPFLDWFEAPAADKKNGVCMILLSGGSYECLCDVNHVRNWTRELTKLGVTCVELVYRTPRPKGLPYWKTAWEDGQRAVRLVRSEAAKRGFDPEKIGTMSMSAGSHLATLLATSSLTPAYAPVDELDKTVPCHINFACPFAIAYALTDGLGTMNSRLGDGPDIKLDPLFKFDSKTCPMCMMHGGKDVYSPIASTRIYRRLREMKIPAELHLYPDKPHGVFGFDRAVEFMRQIGMLSCGAEVPVMNRFADDSARAGHEKKNIWPKGKIPDFRKQQCIPYLEWHMPKELKTKSFMLLYSGGSYQGNSPDGFEVAPVRRYLNSKGMAVATLKYRTPRPGGGLAKHVTAWQDLQRAIRIVRSEAPGRGLDPKKIGIYGCSAGGHLTLMGATSSRHQAYLPVDKLDSIPCNVQWAVAIYPAYALTDGLENNNTGGGNSDSAFLAPEFSFDPDTPPILFIHGDADGWASMNSVKAWEQLRRMGVQGELHTLAKRPHCFMKKASPGTGSYTYLDRIWEFLTAKGFVSPR